jgi:hypothetical protein
VPAFAVLSAQLAPKDFPPQSRAMSTAEPDLSDHPEMQDGRDSPPPRDLVQLDREAREQIELIEKREEAERLAEESDEMNCESASKSDEAGVRHPSTTSESRLTEEDARQGASAEEKDGKKFSEDGKPMIYELIWKWSEALLAKRVPDGTKALVIHQFVFQAKTISTTMRRMVLRDKLVGDVMTLLRQTGLDVCQRDPLYHHELLRSYQRAYPRTGADHDQCVQIVAMLRRFRGARWTTVNASGRPTAHVTYTRRGDIRTVSRPMMERVHNGWKRVQATWGKHMVAQATLPEELRTRLDSTGSVAKFLAQLLIREGVNGGELMPPIARGRPRRRNTSVPLIVSGARQMPDKYHRARSVSPCAVAG